MYANELDKSLLYTSSYYSLKYSHLGVRISSAEEAEAVYNKSVCAIEFQVTFTIITARLNDTWHNGILLPPNTNEALSMIK